MRTVHLACRELFHRRLNFLLGVLGVALAAALVIGGATLLRAHGAMTRSLIEEKRDLVAARNQALTDAMRKITKRMGFNVVITPVGQNLNDPFAADYAAKFMPEEYAERLASSDIVTVNHLLPTLEQRVEWKERGGRTMFLVGVKGQVPLAHRDPRKPIMQPVAKDGLVLGAFLAAEEGLKVGDRATILGEELVVSQVYPRRGDKRDRTAWIELGRMQKLFDKQGEINAIWALECSCALADVGKVRAELQKILPDVTIEEQGEKALARAEARKKSVEIAEASLAEEEESGERLAALGRRFRLLVVPLTILLAGTWLGLLALGNVRERRPEIGLLNALGVGAASIASLFLVRAVVAGVIGAALGGLLGTAAGSLLLASSGDGAPSVEIAAFDPKLFVAVVVVAPVLCALACWLPAMAATQQDPAAVLRSD